MCRQRPPSTGCPASTRRCRRNSIRSRSPRGSEDAPLAPQPTLADIAGLVERTRAAGVSVTLDASAIDTDVPAVTGLTAYRIVQEGMSNAVRHAPGADIAVRVAVEEAAITVTVSNGPSTPDASFELAPGAGLGLAGIRERVHTLAGTNDAGPTPDGGFALRARLPLG